MRPVLTTDEMAAVDAAALASTPLEELVERAGTAVALAAVELLGGAYGRRVVVVCGKGNNGADGRVAARLLARRGARVAVVAPDAPGPLGGGDPPVDLVIDAAFGTGFRGTFEAPLVAPGVPVLAVDIPSGVSGDTGAAAGTPLAAVATITFVAAKPGLLMGDGARLAGQVRVVDIGLPPGESAIGWMEGGRGQFLLSSSWAALLDRNAAEVLDLLLAAGKPHGLKVIGGRSLNSMRLEKSFGTWAREFRPIYGPYEAGLGRFVDLKKADFIGRAAAEAEKASGGVRRLITLNVDATDADAIGDEPIYHNGEVAGWVTSGGYGHSVGKSLAMGYVSNAVADEINGFEVELIGERRAAVRLAEAAFDPSGARMRA